MYEIIRQTRAQRLLGKESTYQMPDDASDYEENSTQHVVKYSKKRSEIYIESTSYVSGILAFTKEDLEKLLRKIST